jgi:hypothetical protein
MAEERERAAAETAATAARAARLVMAELVAARAEVEAAAAAGIRYPRQGGQGVAPAQGPLWFAAGTKGME